MSDFRLTRILDLRRQIEDQRAETLQRRRAEARAVQDEKDRIEAARLRGRAALNRTSATAGELAAMTRTLEALERQLAAADLDDAEAARHVEQARDAYLASHRAAEGLETLRRRHEEAHRQEARRAEQKESDDITASARAARNARPTDPSE